MDRYINTLLSGLLAVPLSLAAGIVCAQSGAGTLEQIRVHGASLEGNLSGEDPSREVFVYLPPSYAAEPSHRYPVVYFLHGYSVGASAYVNLLGLPEAADEAIAAGSREMIIVLPDGNSIYSGSLYSNSPTTGNWEGFIAQDLVAHIDANYRTLARRESRGLAGHSMGGYGTLRVGMKRPEAFGALYAMSSCCLMNQAPAAATVAEQRERTAGGPPQGGRGFANVMLAQAAAWAPNPSNPPLYLDWPYTEDGELDPIVAGRWTANSPLVFVGQYAPALKSYRAIYLDVGDQDSLMATNAQLSQELTELGVAHEFVVYEGDHGNRVASRFREDVMPFFSAELE